MTTTLISAVPSLTASIFPVLASTLATPGDVENHEVLYFVSSRVSFVSVSRTVKSGASCVVPASILMLVGSGVTLIVLYLLSTFRVNEISAGLS